MIHNLCCLLYIPKADRQKNSRSQDYAEMKVCNIKYNKLVFCLINDKISETN